MMKKRTDQNGGKGSVKMAAGKITKASPEPLLDTFSTLTPSSWDRCPM